MLNVGIIIFLTGLALVFVAWLKENTSENFAFDFPNDLDGLGFVFLFVGSMIWVVYSV